MENQENSAVDISLQELEVLSKTVTLTSQIASDNIRRYAELHQGQNASVVKPRPHVMKIVDDATLELKSVVDESVKSAIKNLNRYLEHKTL